VTEQNSPPAAASSKPDTPKGARAVCTIAVDAITVPSERLRKLRPEVVDWLVESITARSLLEPIIVRRRGAGYELVAGRHRFEAARNCGHQTIRAEVYDSLSDDEAAGRNSTRSYIPKRSTAATGDPQGPDQVLKMRT